MKILFRRNQPFAKMKPDNFTLAIPCYNVADTLPETLRSIDSLEPSPGHVLCVDDGSTDETRQILRNYSGATLIEHEKNRGLGATLNSALERTETPWFAKVDADIVVQSNWLESLWRHCTEQGADLVQGKFTESISTTADKWRDWHPSPIFPDEPRENQPINGSNILCRAEALRDVGGWDEQYQRAYDDINLFERLIKAGYTIHYTPKPVANHIRTDTWQDVLRTSWAYKNDYYGNRKYKPEQLSDIVKRAPIHFTNTARDVAHDLSARNFDLIWISTLQFFYHLKYDFEHVCEDSD